MKRTLKVGVVVATAVSAAMPLLATQAAYADYAPSAKDVVGVGSDTLQYMTDFLADGNAYGGTGFNSTGPANKLVSIDATADFNARLAFDANGNNGLGNGSTAVCTPGSSGTAGTGTTGGGAVPCVLNPTVVLRAGQQGNQRPNGSGAGFKALAGDVTDGTYNINFSRASAKQSPGITYGSCGSAGPPVNQCFDSIIVGHENVVMIDSSVATNAVANLTTTQLTNIYSANMTGTNAYGGTGCVTWNEIGGTSTDAVVALIPQPGSGTRSFFLTALGLSAPGSCTTVTEENDPTAIAGQGTKAPDAIEPMSQGRLNMYQGLDGNGTNKGIGGYFTDSTCGFDANTSTCGTGSGSSYFTNSENPPVAVATGAVTFPRDLYLYFRDSDINSTTPMEPGGTQNWLRTLFYNPCQTGQTGCITTTDQEGNTVTYGPGGAPEIDKLYGYTDILEAGVSPRDPVATGNFTRGGI